MGFPPIRRSPFFDFDPVGQKYALPLDRNHRIGKPLDDLLLLLLREDTLN